MPQTQAVNPDAKTPKLEVDEVADRVRAHVLEFLGARLQQLFADADDLLFSMTERAASSTDQNLYLDTMRVLRKQQSLITDRFNQVLSGLFAPAKPRLVIKADAASIDLQTLTLQSSEQLEEELAIASMDAKAGGQFRDALFELERRLPALAPATRVRANFDVLSPRALCTAFQRALADTDIEFPLKLVIYKLFDRLVVSALGGLYERLITLLETNDIHHVVPPQGVGAQAAPAARVDAQTAAMLHGLMGPSAAAPGGGSGVGSAYPPTGAYPTQTVGAASAFAAMPPGPGSAWGAPIWSGATDTSLAQDLASIARGDHPADVAPPQSEALLRRMQLVGGMLNGVLADPYLPAGTRVAIDSLRFPLLKSALSDSEFFASAAHPVRALLNDVAVMAAGSRTSDAPRQQQVEELIRQLREQIDLQAAVVRSALAQTQPLSDEIAEGFLDAQIEQARRRRKAVIDKIRQRVSLELEEHRRARELPKNTGVLLRSAWAPMMGLALLRHGPDSQAWQAGAELLRRVLDTLDPRIEGAAVDQLCADLSQALNQTGLAADRVDAMIAAFRLECAQVVSAEAAVHVPADSCAEQTSSGDSGVASESAPAASGAAGDASRESPAEAAAEPASAQKASAGAAISLTRAECLRRLLIPGQWFRVHDHAANTARWMRMSERGTGRGIVGFSEFNERKVLSVPLNQFVDDLVHRRSDPVDPSPAMTQALQCLDLMEKAATSVAG